MFRFSSQLSVKTSAAGFSGLLTPNYFITGRGILEDNNLRNEIQVWNPRSEIQLNSTIITDHDVFYLHFTYVKKTCRRRFFWSSTVSLHL